MGKVTLLFNSTMKSTLMLLALLGLLPLIWSKHPTTGKWGRQDTEVLDYALIPGFAICNTDKDDGGLTLDELHADICQDFIASVGDSDADGVVTLKEFLDLADSLINQ